MGTAAFAVPCLEALIKAGHPIPAVVTQPDRPHGRGLALQPSPVKVAALRHALDVLQPEKARDPEFVTALAALAPELVVVVAYGQILRPALLELPPLGCVNVHGSLLPELRGAAPIQWAVIRGDTETGVTTMLMDAGMDTGDILFCAREPVRPEDTAGSLSERLAPLGAALLVRTVDAIGRGNAPRTPQLHERATYAPMLKREDGAVDWSAPAPAIRGRIHGCNPAPGAFASRSGRPLKLWRAEVVTEPLAGEPGEVLALDRAGPVVATGEGAVRLLELQPESRPRVTGAEFIRGYRPAVGERLGGGRALLT
jgi:methionyl-tRNA formyltransferase